MIDQLLGVALLLLTGVVVFSLMTNRRLDSDMRTVMLKLDNLCDEFALLKGHARVNSNKIDSIDTITSQQAAKVNDPC